MSNNIQQASAVYILNSGTSANTVSVANSISGNLTIAIAAGQAIIIKKHPADTLTAANVTTMLATPIAVGYLA